MAFRQIFIVLFLCFLGLFSVTVKCQNTGTPTGGGESVSSIVTQKFFNNIIKKAGSGCAGKRFYTRDSFINAANTFSNFSNSVTSLEIATMFAHLTYETGHFCYIKVINGRSRYCDHLAQQSPCIPPPNGYPEPPPNGFTRLSRPYCNHPAEQRDCIPPPKGYFGGGKRLNINLQRQPEIVGSNPTVGFKTSLRFWMNMVRPVLNQGFGATISAISGMDCNGGNSGAINERIRYYRAYCGQLGVDPGSKLSC